MSSLGVKGRINCWEAHERDQQFEENESIDIGKSQRLRQEGNVTINKVSAMRSGLASIIGKECVSGNFERPETDHHVAANSCSVDYADPGSSKLVH